MRVCCLFIFTNKGHCIDLGMKSCIIKVGVKALCIQKRPPFRFGKGRSICYQRRKNMKTARILALLLALLTVFSALTRTHRLQK